MVYGTCLENKRPRKGSVGSNPTPSAKSQSAQGAEALQVMMLVKFEPDNREPAAQQAILCGTRLSMV